MRRVSFLEDAGPGAARGLVVLTLLAGLRAAALILIAESIAASVLALAAGAAVAPDSVVLGLVGVALRVVASWGTTVLAARIAARAKRRWREGLTAHVATAGSRDVGDEAVLATRGLDDLDGYLGTVLPAVVAALVIPLALGLRILAVDPLSALIVAITLPLVPLFMILIGLHSRERADAAAGALARLAAHLVELARGLPVLVGLGRAGEQTAAFARIQTQYRERLDRAVRTALLSALALELIATLSVAVVAVTLGIRLLSDAVALDVALVVLILAPECFAVVREIGASYHQAQDGAAALGRIRAVLQRPVATPRRRSGAPELVGLTIRYPERSTIGPVSVRLPRRGIVVIDGPSGAGKSTLLDAIAGIVDPRATVEGRIDGIGRSTLAAARQTPRFVAPTPREELALVGPDHDALLAELGLGHLGEAPIARLSPGEQRRLAIARALARVDDGARVLLLDEPTAHLDAAAGRVVIAAVRRRSAGRLVIVASHDPVVRAIATRVVPVPSPVTTPSRAPTSGFRWGVDPVTARAVEPVGQSDPLSVPATVVPWVGAVLLSAVAGGMSLALIAVSGWLIVRAADQPAIMYLLVAIVGVRFFGLGRAVARYAERVVGHAAALRLVDRIRLRLWSRLADQGAAARASQDGGHALALLVDLPAQLRDLLARTLSPLLGGLLAVAAAVLVVLFLVPAAWPVAAAIAAAAVVAPLASWAADRRAQAAGVVLRTATIERFAAFAGAADDLRANGSTVAAAGAIDTLGRERERQELRQAIVTATAGTVTGLLTGAGAVVGAVFAGSAELAAVVALLALACLEPITGAAAAAQRIPALRDVVGRLRTGFGAVTPRARADGLITEPVRDLSVDDLTLGWSGEPPVLEGLNLRLDRSTWLAVDGPSGSGKTTFVTAVLGDLAPRVGVVRAGGSDLRSLERDAWRARIAWCPQEAHVFDSTIRANLLLARPRTDPVAESEMRDVLDAVGLADLVRSSPRGLDLAVGAAGSALSGGERQRLAVARALLRRGDVLVLDEPTAHLDEATADAVMTDLRRAAADRIVVLVSHRAGDRRPTDQRLTLDALAS